MARESSTSDFSLPLTSTVLSFQQSAATELLDSTFPTTLNLEKQ
jgi:hypothetical protein